MLCTLCSFYIIAIETQNWRPNQCGFTHLHGEIETLNKEKGKRDKYREGLCRILLCGRTMCLCLYKLAWKKTTFIYAWQLFFLQQANCIWIMLLMRQRHLRGAFSRSLQQPHIAYILCCPLDMHSAQPSLHFEVVHRAMELWLSCPFQSFPCFQLFATNHGRNRATVRPAHRSLFWFRLWMLN